MKRKALSSASFVIFSVLFFILLFAKNNVLFFGSFILIMARGIQLFITLFILNDKAMNQASEIHVAGSRQERFWPLFLTSTVTLLLPSIIVIADLFVFFYRKEMWLHSF